MLTKEECLNALETLCTYADCYPSSSGEFVGKMLQEADDTLQELIEEHFDNPPLKIDELKPNMVVWDNQLKEFIKIEEVLKDVNIITYHVFGESILCGGDFEEDIYYRFEVKDDVHK